MPKFEDLPYIREKIASIADETEVMKGLLEDAVAWSWILGIVEQSQG